MKWSFLTGIATNWYKTNTFLRKSQFELGLLVSSSCIIIPSWRRRLERTRSYCRHRLPRVPTKTYDSFLTHHSKSSILHVNCIFLREAMDHTTDGIRKTPLARKFACGVGNVVNDLFRGMAFSYILIFMMKVAGLTATQAGLIVLVCQFTDSFMGPVVGYCSDKLSIPLLVRCVGRRKAWHLVGTILMVMCLSLMFTRCLVCSDSSDRLRFAYHAILFMILNVAFPAVDVGHLSIIAVVAKNQDECVTLNTLRSVSMLRSVDIICIFLFHRVEPDAVWNLSYWRTPPLTTPPPPLPPPDTHRSGHMLSVVNE